MAIVIDAVADGTGSSRRNALEDVIRLAVELAFEGREGRKVGALFVVGDSDAVLAHSRPLLLDPLHGHPTERRRADRRELRETVKELTQIDGSFIVEDDGVFVAAGRFVSIDFSAASDLPLGLGSRHAAAASISARTTATAIALSQSSIVRIFSRGALRAEISPKLFLGATKSSFSLQSPTVYELSDVGLTVAVAAENVSGRQSPRR